MLSTSIFAAIDGTNQTYTNFKLKIEPSVFSLKFVDVCPRSCDMFTFNIMVKHCNIIHRSLDLNMSDLKAINGLLNETPTLFFCINICTFVLLLALLTTKAWYNMGNHDRLNLFLVHLIFKTPKEISQVGKSIGKSKAVTFDRDGKASVKDAIEHHTREDYRMESSQIIHNARSLGPS